MIPFHHLVWNGDHSEPLQQDAEYDCGLKVGEDVAGTLSATGSPERTKFQPPAGVGGVGGKSIWVEPAADNTECIEGSHTHTHTHIHIPYSTKFSRRTIFADRVI